ncbi:hypothetical protein KSS87_005660 [Heliosperma pusillum]|nr:hypothetical protein KSS87_005660 [Heliosperma pusillum]
MFKPRRRSVMPDWPDEVEFDEEEDVITIDAEENYDLVNNLIQPHDVWHANGVKLVLLYPTVIATIKEFFKPTTMTKAQIYQSAPTKHPRDSWIYLVDYWYSEKGKRFSHCGKEARALLNDAHTTGAKSYVNIRDSFV